MNAERFDWSRGGVDLTAPAHPTPEFISISSQHRILPAIECPTQRSRRGSTVLPALPRHPLLPMETPTRRRIAGCDCARSHPPTSDETLLASAGPPAGAVFICSSADNKKPRPACSCRTGCCDPTESCPVGATSLPAPLYDGRRSLQTKFAAVCWPLSRAGRNAVEAIHTVILATFDADGRTTTDQRLRRTRVRHGPAAD